MSTLKICAMVLTVLVCLNFVACGSNKTDEKSEPTTITTTLGQELQDLDKAYKDGIITEKEYEKAKQKIIEQRTK
ncbi:MAG: DMAP1-binding domain-containing protein [Deltaproteobacteria bacterium]|nr:DMAP1-binding domain-containing protein [Deltaproteobacteria bacterium]